ncbi:MAG TPA: glycosyltransferase family 87 protein [Candidatus Deferrimicrobiaceae bacterium]|nr:glycosyltransferase family 87 protein [Candidatus Deferrimicrobiaceae bacterium]
MRPRLWLVLSLCVAGISWLYVHRILEPWNSHNRLENGFVIAQISDLYSPWVGTRELLLHHRNPYGAEVSHEIQMAFYGRVINQTYEGPKGKLTDEQRFAYPIYEVFLMAPLVYAEFAEVQRWAPFVLSLFVALHVYFCFNILGWDVRWEMFVAIVLLTLSSPQIAQGLRIEQLAIVDGCLLLAAAWCVSRKRLLAAGVLLAVSTIKPQMALLPLCWFAIWSIGDWRKRWNLLAAFLASFVALFAAGELLLPGWPGYFLAGLAAYRKYALPTSLLRMALGDTLGEIVGGLLVLGLIVFAWRGRKEADSSRQFANLLAAFFMVDLLAFPLFTPFNQVLLILPALMLVQEWKALHRFSKLVFVVSIGWPWVVSAVLLLFPPNLNSPGQLPLLPAFLVPFAPLILPVILMAKRRRAIDSPAMNFDPS